MNCRLSGGAGKPLVLVCLTLGLAWPATAQQQQRPHRSVTQVSQVQIQGTVRAEGESKHIPSAVVRLEDLQARVVAEEEVSTNGQFCITGLDPLPYTLIATANGYETYVQRLDLTSVGGMNAVIIILKPNKTEVKSPSARTDATAPTKARKELERGLRASEERRLSEAHAHFENAVKIYPCYARAQVDLALTLMRESDSPRAEAPLKKAIECDPDFVEPYLQLGRLFSAQHRYDESRKILAEGVRRAPSSWQFYYHLGQADEGLKNYPLAAQELLRALSFGPDGSAAVHEKLADVYLRENTYDKAYVEMGAYLQIAPNGQYAGRMRAIMQKLQSAGLVHPTQSQLLSGAPKL